MTRPYIALAIKDGRAVRQFDSDVGYDDFRRSDGRTRLGTPRAHLTIRKRTDWRTVLDYACKAIIILFGIASVAIWWAR